MLDEDVSAGEPVKREQSVGGGMPALVRARGFGGIGSVAGLDGGRSNLPGPCQRQGREGV